MSSGLLSLFATAARNGDIESMKAIWKEHEEEIKPVIDDLVDTLPSSDSHFRCRALVWAASGSSVEAAAFLLSECGAILKLPRESEYSSPSPMDMAIRKGNFNFVTFLASKGWKPVITELQIAVESCQFDILRYLIEGKFQQSELADTRTAKLETYGGLLGPLLQGSSNKILSKLLLEAMTLPDNEAMVAYLIDRVGIDINIPCIECVEVPEEELDYYGVSEEGLDYDGLVEEGLECEVEHQQYFKRLSTPFKMAITDQHSSMMGYFVGRMGQARWNDVPCVIHELINCSGLAHLKEVSMNLLKAILAEGADVNQRDEEGRSPLHITRDPEVINLLFNSGADPMARSHNSASILFVENGNLMGDRIAGLKAKVAQGGQDLVMAKTSAGISALLEDAAARNSLSSYQILLGDPRQFSDLRNLLATEMSQSNETVLHFAAMANSYNNQDNLVDYLVTSKRCVPTDLNDMGQSALHVAAYTKANLQTMTRLIEHGWSVSLKDAAGWTPIHILVSKHVNTFISVGVRLSGIAALIQRCSGIPSQAFVVFPTAASLSVEGALNFFASGSESNNSPRGAELLDIHVRDPKGASLAHKLVDMAEGAIAVGARQPFGQPFGRNPHKQSMDALESIFITFSLIEFKEALDHPHRQCFLRSTNLTGQTVIGLIRDKGLNELEAATQCLEVFLNQF